MKKILISILSLLLMVAVSACQKGHSPEGVQVGNGMKTYTSSLGYQLTYAASLSLVEKEAGKNVSLDNSKLTSTDVSHLETRVISGTTLKTLDDLRGYAEADSRAALQDVAGLGLPAVETRTALGSTLIRYLLMPGGSVLKFTLQASAVGDGLGLLLPVVETAKVDTQAPTVKFLRWETKQLEAGKAATFLVEAEDDLSGIDLARAQVSLFGEDAGGKLNSPRVKTVMRATKEKNVYSVEVTPSVWAVPADYYLYVSVYDVAGNSADNKYENGQARLDATLPLVNAGQSDSEGPELLDIEMPKEITAGKEWVIRFKAKDDVSGIQTGKKGRADMLTVNLWGTYDDRDVLRGIPGYQDAIEVTREEKTDWYRATLPSSKYSAGSVGLVEFAVWDAAGNQTLVHRSFLDKEKCEVVRRGHGTRPFAEQPFFAKTKFVGSESKLPEIVSLSVSPRAVRGDTVEVSVSLQEEFAEEFAKLSVSIRPHDGRDFVEGAWSRLEGRAQVSADKKRLVMTVRTEPWMATGNYQVREAGLRGFSWSSNFEGLEKKGPVRITILGAK